MSEVLDTAKSTERDQSNRTHVTIRLTLLQDLIAEIERLQAAVPPGSVKLVKELASQRALDQQRGPL